MLDLLDETQPFALIEKDGRLHLYQGDVYELGQLSEIHELARRENADVVFILPYHVIRERGFEAKGEEPIIGLAVHTQHSFRTADVCGEFPNAVIELNGDITPSLTDKDYADLVANFQSNEIEGGNVSQTTLSRKFKGQIENLNLSALLGTFARIIEQSGHYMAVLYANPDVGQYIIAATPERHLEVTGTQTIMTPIAGTLRKEDRKSFSKRLRLFIKNEKEINELFQVLDEEMKIMGLICPEGGAIEGPFLREVGAVLHSEYDLIGKRTLRSIDALRETLHAPTVVGSPMESAARVIARYEPESRRYYGGEIGVYRQPRSAAPDGDIDSAILIRMAEIAEDGSFVVQAGGGLVRDSDPADEARESAAKAQGILRCFQGATDFEPYFTGELQAEVAPLFEKRNEDLSPFWMNKQNPNIFHGDTLGDKTITIINNEDNFAHMISHLVHSFGANVIVVDTFDFDPETNDADLVILGPGPGNPNDESHPRMKRLREIVAQLCESKKPLLGICLGHQMISLHLGLEVEQQTSSTQGMPRVVRVQGDLHQLGFYNSFSPVASSELPDIRLELDEQNRVIALHGDQLIGFQFHPESVMSRTGVKLLFDALARLVAQRT